VGLLKTVCSGNGTQRLQLGLPVCSTTYPCTGLAPPQCIGATTLDEHRKHIERDAALERCAALLVAPPGQSDVVHTRLPALLSSMHCRCMCRCMHSLVVFNWPVSMLSYCPLGSCTHTYLQAVPAGGCG